MHIILTDLAVFLHLTSNPVFVEPLKIFCTDLLFGSLDLE